MTKIGTSSFTSFLLLFVLSLHTITHSLVLPKNQTASLKAGSAASSLGADSLTADDSDDETRERDVKPPKQSFIDYSTFLTADYLLPPRIETVAQLFVTDRFQEPPEVFLELVVPPHPA